MLFRSGYDPQLQLADTLLAVIDPEGFPADHKAAITGRPEYQLMHDAAKAENFQYRMKLGEYLPQAAVGAGALTYNMGSGKNNNLMLYGSLSIPLSGWWEASHTLRQHRIREEIARIAARNTSELLILEMENARILLTESYQRWKICGIALGQAGENLRITRNNYKAGIYGVSDLLEAQAAVQRAEEQLAEARNGYFISLAAYKKATGREE